jgi:AcrR family transcriptional regulator
MDLNPGNRTDRKKLKTQRLIIDAAVALFTQNGYENVTMESIAEKADIAKGTLYNYFPSKEAIVHAFLQVSFEENSIERINTLHSLPDSKARVTWVLSFLLEGVQRQKEIFQVFMLYRMKNTLSLEPLEESQQSGLTLLINEILHLGQSEGDLRSDLPQTILEGLFEFALIEAIKPYYLDPENFNREIAVSQAVDIFLHGAAA